MARCLWIISILVLVSVLPVFAGSSSGDLTPPVTLSVKDTPVKDVIDQIFARRGLSWVIESGCDARISADFADEPFDSAIFKVMKSANLMMTKERGIFIFKPRTEAPFQGKVVRAGLVSGVGKPQTLTIKCSDQFDLFDASTKDYVIMCIDSPVTLSADGKRIKISTEGPAPMEANADGSITISGPARFISHNPNAVFDISSIKKDPKYAGILEIKSTGAGLFAIDELPLEDYVRGVIPIEVPKSFQPEAQKALAVAIRTYALRNIGAKRHDGYDVCDNTHCQGFGGASKAADWVDVIVSATSNEILTYKGQPICAAYSTDCGGMTESNEDAGFGRDPLPYLRSTADNPGDPASLKPIERPTSNVQPSTSNVQPSTSNNENGLEPDQPNPTDQSDQTSDNNHQPSTIPAIHQYIFPACTEKDFCSDCRMHDWEKRFTSAELEKKLNVGKLEYLDFTEYNDSGRVKVVVAKGDKKTRTMTGYQFRSLFGENVIKSTRMVLSITPDGSYLIEGRGYGHGVGLCAFGANGLAKQGKNYKDILAHYYPGTRLETAD